MEVLRQAELAATAILARQAAIAALATANAAHAAAPVVPPLPGTRPVSGARPSGEGSQISVQSVLAVVGATLLAVAAIVFTFLNPDLTNFATRTTIIAVTSGVFIAGAWLLARARLQFSAEAIGALGLVFVALDIWAFSHGAPRQISPFVFAGIGTAVSSIVLLAIAAIARIRSWLWLGALGLTITPAWFGYAVGTPWSAVAGHLAVGFAAFAVHELIRRLGGRMRSPLRADHWAITIVQLAVVLVVFVQLFAIANAWQSPWSSESVAALALMAVFGCRNELARVWSFTAGSLVAVSAILVVTALRVSDDDWLLTLVPTAAAVALAVLAVVCRVRLPLPNVRVNRALVIAGGLSVLLASSFVQVGIGGAQYLSQYFDFLPRGAELPSALGVAATALGAVAVWGLAPRPGLGSPRHAALVISLYFVVVAAISAAGWPGLGPAGEVGASLGAALALCLVLLLLRTRSTRLGIRLPLFIGAHLLVIQGAELAWKSGPLSELGGVAAILAWVVLTAMMPRIIRPAHAGIGFAYALIVFAHVLQLARLDDVAILSLTASVASAVALVVTLARRVGAAYWYAFLIVAVIPFILGIVDVLFVRSPWTALSTTVTFALALTLLLTNRSGLSRYLRAIAAALLVPALAVVVIDLGATLISQSASPITLPVIAVIVACVLPSTQLVGIVLVRRGKPAADARLARLGIEASTLVTAAVAVVLALVRAAAGLHTSFLVLLIVGIGAAATAIFMHRRYGWIVAAASWTGALWSFWGILGIGLLEPYLLPPAVGAAIVGAVCVLRKLPGLGLYVAGLACAAVPSLAVLAIAGNGAITPWRNIGLLGGAILLLVLGVVLGVVLARRAKESRARTLALPTLLAAMLAAAAAPIEAIRVSAGADPRWLGPDSPVMLTAVVLGVIAAVLAGAAARSIVTPARLARSSWRWVYMPALLWLVIGPVSAVRAGWIDVWTLLALSLMLLIILVATVWRARTHPVSLPPVWFTFGLAWCVAVAGWSIRSLRVEAFSLPLGIALLLAGIITMRAASPTVVGRSLNSWPIGFVGSWRLLGPGIVVTFLPSILATGTDPQTWRAILVIAAALLAILIGSLRRLGAPFILGIVVLPIENITVFAAQIVHAISATSWWITLATAGAVLLVIAVTYERRSSGNRGVAARLRDLR